MLQFRGNGTVDDKIVDLRAGSSVRVRALDVPPKNVHFAIVQAHSQIYPVTLAQDRTLEVGNHVNGTSIGIFVEMSRAKGGVMAHLFNHQPFNVTVLVFILFYDRTGSIEASWVPENW